MRLETDISGVASGVVPRAERRALIINLTIAAILAVGSVAALAGWVYHNPSFMQINVNFAPTQFNTALAFLFFAAGLALTGLRRPSVVRLLAAPALVLGGLTIAEYVTNLSFGVDTWSGYFLTSDAEANPGRMAISSACAVAALGVILLLWAPGRRSNLRGVAIAALGSLIVAVGVGAVFGYLTALHSVHGWIGFTQIGMPSAILSIIAGANTIWNGLSEFEDGEIWLPIPLGVGLLALLATLTQALYDDQDARFAETIRQSAQDLADRTNARLSDMFTALDRMASRWDVAGGTPFDLWQSDAAAYVHGYHGLIGISWVGPDGRIRRVQPSHGSHHLIGTSLFF